MLKISGDVMEGGGQIIRTAMALSAITGESCKIEKIRHNRPNPGLQPQHLAAVKGVAKICGTKINAKIGDTSLVFEPHEIRGGNYDVDIGTAGAISLVMQSIILPSIHAKHPTTLTVKGGTHVRWSPSMDYMQQIFCYYMKKIGIDVDMKIEKYGFYPKGGGLVSVKINPGKPKPLCLTERSKHVSNEAVSIASEDLKKANVAERQLAGAEKLLHLDKKNVSYVSSASPGSSIHVSSVYDNCILGSSSIGERGKSAESVGEEAAHEMNKQAESRACLDMHMADQLLPFLAFAEGDSVISVADITDHVRTNIWVIEKFLPVKFKINEKEKIINVIKNS